MHVMFVCMCELSWGWSLQVRPTDVRSGSVPQRRVMTETTRRRRKKRRRCGGLWESGAASHAALKDGFETRAAPVWVDGAVS